MCPFLLGVTCTGLVRPSVWTPLAKHYRFRYTIRVHIQNQFHWSDTGTRQGPLVLVLDRLLRALHGPSPVLGSLSTMASGRENSPAEFAVPDPFIPLWLSLIHHSCRSSTSSSTRAVQFTAEEAHPLAPYVPTCYVLPPLTRPGTEQWWHRPRSLTTSTEYIVYLAVL
jgi:hypothetical protein